MALEKRKMKCKNKPLELCRVLVIMAFYKTKQKGRI